MWWGREIFSIITVPDSAVFHPGWAGFDLEILEFEICVRLDRGRASHRIARRNCNCQTAYLNQLDQSPRPRLSREEVDAWIESERTAWD